MKASDAIAALLERHGVKCCFELIGGTITHIIDSISKSKSIEIISMHHEQAAAFAAEGVARATGLKNIAVAMGTSGPGATNMVTGIASCWLDSIPCLFITGQVNTEELRPNPNLRQQGFQELDIISMVEGITKYSVQINNSKKLLEELHKALEMANEGRCGPVLVDIPNNIQKSTIDDEIVHYWLNKPLRLEGDVRLCEKDKGVINKYITTAQKPLICFGGGAIKTKTFPEWLENLNMYNIPYVATLMGIERIADAELFLGMIGTYGHRVANWAVQNCDLLIVLGARLDIRQTGANVADFARNAKIIHVDIDEYQLNNRIISDISIKADVESFYNSISINDDLKLKINKDWVSTLLNKKKELNYDEYEDYDISPCKVFGLINCAFEGMEVHYVADVGNHQMWAAQFLKLENKQFLHNSGGLGAMGFSLPVAIGIAITSKSKVVVITGDGGFQINIQELDTIKRLNLDITIIIMNNYQLGMVKNFQDMYFDGNSQSTKIGYSTPDFTKVGSSYGLMSYKLSSYDEISSTLSNVSNQKIPLVLELNMAGASECRPRLTFGSKLDNQYPFI